MGTRGIGGGVCVWSLVARSEGGETVLGRIYRVARDQPAARSKDARKKRRDFLLSTKQGLVVGASHRT